MKVFNTDMHIVTFIFVIFETVMLLYQVLFYLQRPFEQKRLYYIILLTLFLIYNICGGLFPDPKLTSIPLQAQNLLAWGSGFALACFFPYYFFKSFALDRLRFHARYGILLFLVIPFCLFFGVEYLIFGNIHSAVKHGVIIPFFYAIVCMSAVFKAIKRKGMTDSETRNEMLLVYLGLAPWISMPILSYFGVSQLPEVLVMNGGFLLITGIFIWRDIQQSRKDILHLQVLLSSVNDSEVKEDAFMNNCKAHKLSPREIEVAALIADGLKYKEIAERLFIQERTVTTHVTKTFIKTGAKNKVDLLNILKGKN
jgi:DNA-binding CsgD family transcriptional regulator